MRMSLQLKKYRREQKLTQAKLATKLGVSFATVNRWERGHADPSAEMLKKIHTSLGIAVSAEPKTNIPAKAPKQLKSKQPKVKAVTVVNNVIGKKDVNEAIVKLINELAGALKEIGRLIHKIQG